MRKGIVILLIIAAALTVIGGAIFTVGVLTMGDEGFVNPNEKYQEKTYESTDKIDSITIKTGTADVEILPYDNEGYKVECIEEKNLSHKVSVKEGSLCIEIVDTRAWYDHISLFSMPTKITVYVPAGEYSSLSVKSSTGRTEVDKAFTFDSATVNCSTGNVAFSASTKESLAITASTGRITVGNASSGTFTHGNITLSTSTGNITVHDLVCKDAKITVSTGKTIIYGMKCESLFSTGDTGELSMSDVIAKGSIAIERSTGDVKLDRCDAAELDIVTDTGDVTGSLLSEKVFIYKTDTGDVDLPETTTGGTCRITTDTGDIKIGIAK